MAVKNGLSQFVHAAVFISGLQVLLFGFTSSYVIQTENEKSNKIMKNHTVEVDFGGLSRTKKGDDNGGYRDTSHIDGYKVKDISLEPNKTDKAALFEVMMKPKDVEDADEYKTVNNLLPRGCLQGHVRIKAAGIGKVPEDRSIFEKMGIQILKQQTSFEHNATKDEKKYNEQSGNKEVEKIVSVTESAEDAAKTERMMVPNDDDDKNDTNTPVVKSTIEGLGNCPEGHIRVNGVCVPEI